MEEVFTQITTEYEEDQFGDDIPMTNSPIKSLFNPSDKPDLDAVCKASYFMNNNGVKYVLQNLH